MKTLVAVLLAFFVCADTFGQTKTDLQKLVETEIAFAKTAESKGTRAAFLEFLAADALLFNPLETNGKAFWSNRPESAALLGWAPSWADISSDGNLGYTTGGWELRPNGKTDKPSAFGQYATVWRKEPDGKFKAVLDIGVSFDASALKSGWSAPGDAGKGERKIKSTNDLGALINDIYSKKQLSAGYFNHLADDAIVLREKHQPFYGKQQAFGELFKLDREFPSDGVLNLTAKTSKNYGNMMYSWGVYQLIMKDKSVARWNFAQIWKHRAGRWQIVLDVFKPIPPEKTNDMKK